MDIAANIIVTLQTVKMVLAGAEESSVEKRCSIAGELLDALAAIPTAYIAAISSPMVGTPFLLNRADEGQLHHLASVGHLLSTVIQGPPLSPWSFLQVRNVLLAIADLLSGLELALSYPSDISTKLKAHVCKIDTYMATAAISGQRAQVYHIPRPAHASDSTFDSDNTTTGNSSRNTPTGLSRESHVRSIQEAPFDEASLTADLMDDWTFKFSPEHQIQLQTDLTTDWPFEIGGGGLFDFLVGLPDRQMGNGDVSEQYAGGSDVGTKNDRM